MTPYRSTDLVSPMSGLTIGQLAVSAGGMSRPFLLRAEGSTEAARARRGPHSSLFPRGSTAPDLHPRSSDLGFTLQEVGELLSPQTESHSLGCSDAHDGEARGCRPTNRIPRGCPELPEDSSAAVRRVRTCLQLSHSRLVGITMKLPDGPDSALLSWRSSQPPLPRPTRPC